MALASVRVTVVALWIVSDPGAITAEGTYRYGATVAPVLAAPVTVAKAVTTADDVSANGPVYLVELVLGSVPLVV